MTGNSGTSLVSSLIRQLPEARVRELRGAVVDPQRRLDVIGWAVMGAGGALALGGLVMAAWAKYC